MACQLARRHVWDNTLVELRDAGRPPVAGWRWSMLFQNRDSAGLAMRASLESQPFIVERSQASAVTAFMSEAVSELAQAKEPVP